MHRYLVLNLCLLLCLGGLVRAEAPGRYVDKTNSFSLIPPSGWVNVTSQFSNCAVAFAGPVEDGFAVNINIQVQRYGGTLVEYARLSEDQIKQSQGKVVSRKSLGTGREIVWTCTMQGKKLQFLSLFLVEGGKAYLFTGTALQSNWGKFARPLQASADSFQLRP